jgi:putative hydrolase of the HAD superfamily
MSQPWVILDGDDTLWKTTEIYDRARTAVCEMVAAHGHDFEEVSHWAQVRDADRAQIVGYSMHRFPTTLRETAEHFGLSLTEAWAALGLGYFVYQEVATPRADSRAFLRALKEDGWRLALLTAGEQTVQEKRVMDFPHRQLLEKVVIVPKKDLLVYENLARELGLVSADCWMVGDSLRSDVVPAAAAGFNTVLLETHNWALYEKASHSLPQSAFIASSLSGVLDIIQQSAGAVGDNFDNLDLEATTDADVLFRGGSSHAAAKP